MTNVTVTAMAPPPLNESIAIAVSRLVDDKSQRRDPSHWELGIAIGRAGLAEVDPHRREERIGKFKRLQEIFLWAVDNDPRAGGELVRSVIAAVRASGGFRSDSPNAVPSEAIANAAATLGGEGWLLTADGELAPRYLDEDEFGAPSASEALRVYVRRANKGFADAALVTGTGKDLLEATAAHTLVSRRGTYDSAMKFPTLLGLAFAELQLSTQPPATGAPEKPQDRMVRTLYNLACAVNTMRNKEGTGHGRPFLPGVTPAEADAAVRTMGLISSLLLTRLGESFR